MDKQGTPARPHAQDLLEHFSALKLGNAHVNTDIIDNGYEFLIKKFADDSGHTAQEFYTNRIVVHLMAQMLEPKPGEKIYDPTCGTGGMLISALDEVKRKGGEYRTLKLYGQERNHMTASIARMIWRCTAWTISPSPAETRLNIPPSPTKTVSPHLTWCWRTRPIPSVIG